MSKRLLAGWEVSGWALGAVLWFGLELIELVLTRLRSGTANVAASVYMVYLLEIVKLANPIIRRREEQTRAERNKVA